MQLILSLFIVVTALEALFAVSAFRPHLSMPFSARSVQSCLIGDLTCICSLKGWRARPFEPEVVELLSECNVLWTSVDFMEEGQ